MFTPPPSPRRTTSTELPLSSTSGGSTHLAPPIVLIPSSKGKEAAQNYSPQSNVEVAKRRTGRRYRFAVFAIPLLLITLTLTTTYVLQTPSRRQLTWPAWIDHNPFLPSLHRRDLSPQVPPSPTLAVRADPSPTAGASSTSSLPVSAQHIPIVPTSPPPLPTPFPQAFDEGTVPLNFSSASCSSFFSNMTASSAFRTCRPFSLLLQTSSNFLEAQANLTLMNNLIWGTCNTKTAYTQCQANMSWFAGSLQAQCTQELKDRNTLTLTTLSALQAFEVMHDIACLQNPKSNTYCYLDAVRTSPPSDTYYYFLPLGISLPRTIQLTCSPCSQSIMGIFSKALKDPANAGKLGGGDLKGLATTYEQAAEVCRANCGAEFATVNVVKGGGSSLNDGSLRWWMALGGVLSSWVLLGSL